MRLENILALTHGSLKNDPFITAFDGISYHAKRVKRGDLFIAQDPDSIAEAVFNGAYGIIFDRPTQISDNEIAWIKVDSIDDAMLRLLRFRLLEKELNVYHCDTVTLALARQIMASNDFIVLSPDPTETFRELWDCEQGATVLYDSAFTNSHIFTSSQLMPVHADERVEIIEQTLFETSFIYQRIFYERQQLSAFFIPYLERLLNFLDSMMIRFRLRTFKALEHFEACFINGNLEPVDFGGSDKVLIFEPDFGLIASEMDYLSVQANWARRIYLLPETKGHRYKGMPNVFTYRDPSDIINTLKSVDFHFALIAEQNRDILETLHKDEQPQQLFLDF